MTRILLVEDNEMNRDMLSRRLERRGYTVDVAVDGQEGIDAARSLQPDVILLDMSLPVKDGWMVASELKQDESTRGIGIIALTAHAMEGDRERSLEAGCDDYDIKPVDFQRLLKKIDSLVARRPSES